MDTPAIRACSTAPKSCGWRGRPGSRRAVRSISGVNEHAARADIDGVLRNYLIGVRMALGGAAGYRVGVRASQAWCGGLVDRGLAALSWLAQAAPDAGGARHALLQWPAARIVLDGAELRLSPVLGQPGCDPGLFQLLGRSQALGALRR